MLKAAQERLPLCEIREKRSSPPSSTKEGEVSPPANYANEANKGESGSYAHPWADAIADMGPRRAGPFDPCAEACGRWSWVRYGDTVLCLPCTRRVLASSQPPDHLSWAP
jgi:hypothetical protein